MNSCIYTGTVRHARVTPAPHRFDSRLFLMCLDLDELDEVFRGRWFWSTRRMAVARFRREDHFGDPDVPLDQTVRDLVARRTGLQLTGPIRLLTHLRYWGFVFNPVSFYFCHASPDDPEPAVVVAEVTNTPWGQRHCYVLTRDQFARDGEDGPTCGEPSWLPKEFHVSPFMAFDQEYRWRIGTRGDQLAIAIQTRRQGKRQLAVAMQLTRQPINSWTLFSVLARWPWMTAGIVVRIYWQAFRLWWKGVPFVPHPFKGLPHGNETETRQGSLVGGIGER